MMDAVEGLSSPFLAQVQHYQLPPKMEATPTVKDRQLCMELSRVREARFNQSTPH
jgi:hypothetical protein